MWWQVPGKFLSIVGQDPSDSKSNRLHVDIFRFCVHSLEVYSSIDSSETIGYSPEVLNSNRVFLQHTSAELPMTSHNQFAQSDPLW